MVWYVSFSPPSIATFDTQFATVVLTPEPGRVTVECTFAQNSSAKGCLVTFSETSESADCELELHRTKSELQATGQITLPRGTYHPQAYDIERDGTNLLKQPAVTMEAFTIEDSTTLGKAYNIILRLSYWVCFTFYLL